MAEVTVTVSGPVGCGKSAIAGEIEIALRAIGVPVRYADPVAAQSEKNMTHADWSIYLDMYKPEVLIVEGISCHNVADTEKIGTIENVIKTLNYLARTGGHSLDRETSILRAIAEDYRKRPTFDQVFDVIEQKVGLDGDMHGPVITGIASAAEAVMKLFEGTAK